MILNGAKVLRAAVAGVGAQMLAPAIRRILAIDHDRVEHLVEPFAVMNVGPGHDDRQRNATAVHQQVALGALFSPIRRDLIVLGPPRLPQRFEEAPPSRNSL